MKATFLQRLAPFLDLLDARFLPLLFAYAPQAYTVYAWLKGSGTPEQIALLGGIGFEFISVGAIAWAERGAGWQAARGPALTALAFSVAVAVAHYATTQGTLAILHAGFPLVAYFYTLMMHSRGKEELPKTEAPKAKVASVEDLNFWISVSNELTKDVEDLRKKLKTHQPLPAPRPSTWTREGFVYILQADTGAYKIGRAVDVEARMQSIASFVPFSVNLVHSIATTDMVKLERALHRCFTDRRLRGEWFALTDTDLDTLQAIGDSVPVEQIDDVIDTLSLVVNAPQMLNLEPQPEEPEIVRLKEREGLSFAQIGERLGISRQAAWQQYQGVKKPVKELS